MNSKMKQERILRNDDSMCVHNFIYIVMSHALYVITYISQNNAVCSLLKLAYSFLIMFNKDLLQLPRDTVGER